MPLALDVTDGLQYLHRSNIVHGDLKARNILVSDRGRALISDFGISHIVVSLKLPSTQLSSGTMRWMAPELLQDYGENIPPVTFQSDVWSLGCVFYEIFTRKVPFYHCGSDNRVSLTRLDPMATPTRPTDGSEVDYISDAMWDLLKICWDHKPHSRPSCNNIYEFIIGYVKVREQQCSQNDTLWKVIRGGLGIRTIYERARHILFQVDDVHHSDSRIAYSNHYPEVLEPVTPRRQFPEPIGIRYRLPSTTSKNVTSPVEQKPSAYGPPQILPGVVPSNAPWPITHQPSSHLVMHRNQPYSSMYYLNYLTASTQQLSRPSSSGHGQRDIAGYRHTNDIRSDDQQFSISPPTNERSWAPVLPLTPLLKNIPGCTYPQSHVRRRVSIRNVNKGKAVAKYVCQICGETFTSKQSAIIHRNADRISEPFRCKKCGKQCYAKIAYDHHIINCGDKQSPQQGEHLNGGILGGGE